MMMETWIQRWTMTPYWLLFSIYDHALVRSLTQYAHRCVFSVRGHPRLHAQWRRLVEVGALCFAQT
jgi:hypothetical protein